MFFTGILTMLPSNVLGSVYDILQEFVCSLNQELMGFLADIGSDLIETSLLIENALWVSDNPMTRTLVRELFHKMYGYAFILLELKFLWKGFQVYILWRDGDSDVSPHGMLIGAGEAVAVCAAFPLLYEYGVDFSVFVGMNLEEVIQNNLAADRFDIPYFISKITTMSMVTDIVLLVFIIAYLVLYLKLMARGFEMFFLRIGVPIAAIGLVDSDSGIFKPYIQLILRQMATSIVQVLAMFLGLYFVLDGGLMHILMGIAALMTAFRVPTLLSQFLSPQRGGGGGSYTAMMLLQHIIAKK